jgi:glutamate synthase domain-containing protein 2
MAGGKFSGDLIRQAHERLVEAGLREQVTLVGSGGIIMAEHVPKAIACGLDAVALDTALLVALQACFSPGAAEAGRVRVPGPRLEVTWGVRRIRNLAASWRDQLLEVLGAMGLREVRRLRGELGRLIFQQDLEQEAFGGIEGQAR